MEVVWVVAAILMKLGDKISMMQFQVIEQQNWKGQGNQIIDQAAPVILEEIVETI